MFVTCRQPEGRGWTAVHVPSLSVPVPSGLTQAHVTAAVRQEPGGYRVRLKGTRRHTYSSVSTKDRRVPCPPRPPLGRAGKRQAVWIGMPAGLAEAGGGRGGISLLTGLQNGAVCSRSVGFQQAFLIGPHGTFFPPCSGWLQSAGQRGHRTEVELGLVRNIL